MSPETDAAAPARTWRVVLAHLEADLAEGRLGPGDRLPSERDLVARLGVGRSSVREALRVLEVMGLIRTATGSGPQAGAIVIARPAGGLGALMRLQVAAQGFEIADIVATRLLLERSVVRALAVDGADLAPVRELLAAMDDPRLSPEEFLAIDARFHVALAEASRNAVTAAIMSGLRHAIEGYVRDLAPVAPDWDAEAQRLRAEHAGILRAVEAGDPDAAATRIHDHITRYHRHAARGGVRPEGDRHGHAPAAPTR